MERKTSALRLEEGLGGLEEEECNLLMHQRDEDDEAQCMQKQCRECKYDGRLFPEYPLYHEGMHKPYFRGVLHFILAFILPFGYVHFFMESNGNEYAIYTSFFYISTNIFCYGMSGLFHTIEWPPQTEILLQKLDHCGIAILSVGTFLPVAVLLMEYPYGLIFVAMLASTCTITCYYILNGQPSVVRQAMVPACLFPFIPYLYGVMTPFEFTCMICCIVFQVTGMSIFVNERPDYFPAVFGYHELFHCFVSAAGACVYLCNWSVVHRLCQGSQDHPE
jgi:hemolysin III